MPIKSLRSGLHYSLAGNGVKALHRSKEGRAVIASTRVDLPTQCCHLVDVVSCLFELLHKVGALHLLAVVAQWQNSIAYLAYCPAVSFRFVYLHK